MFRHLLLAAAAIASVAQADVRMHDQTDAVSMPYAGWELRFPGAGWVLQQAREAPDGTQLYYVFSNARRKMIASFFLEPAYKCASGEACRDRFWANPGPAYLNRANDRFFDSGPFSVVEFTTETVVGLQRHWSAHTVYEGVWIDMHLSSLSQPDFSALKSLGEEAGIDKKAACPDCFAMPGIPRRESAVLFGKARANDKAAFDRLKELADSGDPEAQFTLGRLYSFGSPFTKSDETQSVALTRKAAEQGHAEAQSNLGYFYYSGRGVPEKSPQLAVDWWSKAAEKGFAQAQHNLASYYGQEKDAARSFEWNLKAAEQGLAAAQADVGYSYLRGAGTSRNVEQALDWYRKAAMQANPRAMLNLAAALAMLGPADRRFYDAAVSALDEPLLRGVEAAQKLRASICTASPASCGKNPA